MHPGLDGGAILRQATCFDTIPSPLGPVLWVCMNLALPPNPDSVFSIRLGKEGMYEKGMFDGHVAPLHGRLGVCHARNCSADTHISNFARVAGPWVDLAQKLFP